MKRIVFTIVFIFFFLSNVFSQDIYYVSVLGSDRNDGSELKPWKTAEHAFKHIGKDVKIIFDDGVYLVKKELTINGVHSLGRGVEVKARNKHKVTLLFDGDIVKDKKFNIINSSNIRVEGLKIKSTRKRKNNTADILLLIRNSSNISIINNEFSNSFEEGLKVTKSREILIENNLVFDFDHEGVDFLDVSNSIIRNNTIKEIGRVGIMVKGGSNDISVLNNLIENNYKRMSTAGITIGGMTIFSSARSSSKGSYEAVNVIAANNHIYANGTGYINNGVAFYGAYGCYLLNTEINGSSTGILLKQNNSKKYGWEENVNNNRIKLINNSVINVLNKELEILNRPQNISVNDFPISSQPYNGMNKTGANLNQSVKINERFIYFHEIINDKSVGRVK